MRRSLWIGIAIALALSAAFTSLTDLATRRLPARADESHLERVFPAAAFADSVGVNVHLSYHDGPYGNVTAVNALLKQLGARHLRDGTTPDESTLCALARSMNAAFGVRFDYLTGPRLTPEQLEDWAVCAGPAIEAFEGPNEYDASHPKTDTNWVQTIQNYVRVLSQTVRTSPKLSKLPLIAPSFTSVLAYRAVGNLGVYFDFGNMHNYFAGHEPGTAGWGEDGYGSISWSVDKARIVAGDHPIMSTENGYSTSPADTYAVDSATQAIYVPELFLEQFAAGIVRTYYYELLDEGGPPFSHYGLATAQLQPKPAFNALADLLTLARTGEQSAHGAPTATACTIEGGNPAVHHVILGRNDGSLLIGIWQSKSLYDSAAHVRDDPEPQQVTVRCRPSMESTAVYVQAADGHFRATPSTSGHSVMQLTLGASLLLVTASPEGR